MADSPHFATPDLVKAALGLAGALVSLRFIKDTSTPEKVLLVLGGSVMSFVGTGPVTTYFAVLHAEGLVGFLLGLFGMALTTKVYEAIQLVDTKQIVEALSNKFFPKKRD